jgi:hypothetical protein
MTSAARRIVRLDSLVEAVLAVVCAGLAAGNPQAGRWRLPAHLDAAVVWILAVVLLALAAVLWRWSARPVPSRLIVLAGGNAVTALLTVVYLSFVDAGGAVKGLLVATVVALMALAITQAGIAWRMRQVMLSRAL